MTEQQVLDLAKALRVLTPSQLDWVKGVIAQFQLPHRYVLNPESDWVRAATIERFGDALRIHHAFSRQPLTKDRFEYALELCLNQAGDVASLVQSRTNRGHDITVAGLPVSLKTEAASNIREDLIHVSKWMELGRGEWNLPTLRDLFIEHMKGYARIFTLRCLESTRHHYRYELVEIPKKLMLEAKNCKFEVMERSKQNPKPGYGYIRDENGDLKFALYFDGGTERKLQVKNIKKSLCFLHATWEFDSAAL